MPTLLELINKLENTENATDTTQVEFIVVTKEGQLVCADVDETAKSMINFLKLFAEAT